MYATRAVPEEVPAGNALTVAARRDLYGDAFNERVFMRPGQMLTAGLVEIDDEAVDGAGTGLATVVSRVSNALRQLQTGFARSYALSMLGGAALVVAFILAVRLW
jgi:NADH-quinone oxidoreductase subunit L